MKNNNTSIEVSLYYDKVNELVDKYINDWNVKPSNLFNYLKPGNKRFDTFITKNKLSDFKLIKKIVTDVLEDRVAMENDGLLIFENKLITESILSAIEPSSINHEKILADLYNTSLGHINITSIDKHLYNVNDFGKKIDVIIYSDDEIEKVKSNIQAGFIDKISDKKMSIDSIGVVFKLSDIIASDKLANQLNDNIDYEKLMEYILKFFKSELMNKELNHKTFKNYHIWEIVS